MSFPKHPSPPTLQRVQSHLPSSRKWAHLDTFAIFDFKEKIQRKVIVIILTLLQVQAGFCWHQINDMEQKDFTSIMDFIAAGELEEAICLALEIAKTQDGKFLERMVLLSCRLNRLNDAVDDRRISRENENSEIAQIATSLLNIAKKMANFQKLSNKRRQFDATNIHNEKALLSSNS